MGGDQCVLPDVLLHERVSGYATPVPGRYASCAGSSKGTKEGRGKCRTGEAGVVSGRDKSCQGPAGARGGLKTTRRKRPRVLDNILNMGNTNAWGGAFISNNQPLIQ